MNDRELLEMAAKAYGVDGSWDTSAKTFFIAEYLRGPSDDSYEARDSIGLANGRIWYDPIHDDGDALRLAVKLDMTIRFYGQACAQATRPGGTAAYITEDYVVGDRMASCRLSIVRAAAEIGKGIIQQVNNDLPEDNYYKTEAESVAFAAAEIGKTK